MTYLLHDFVLCVSSSLRTTVWCLSQAATHAEREIMREVHFHDDSVN